MVADAGAVPRGTQLKEALVSPVVEIISILKKRDYDVMQETRRSAQSSESVTESRRLHGIDHAMLTA